MSVRSPEEEDQLALGNAVYWHQGVKNKFSGEDYIEHPKRVSQYVPLAVMMLGASGAIDFEDFYEEVILMIQRAALNHDVLEDTGQPEPSMREILGGQVTDLVVLVSRNFTKTPEAYYSLINASPRAKVLKFADIMDNADPKRIAQVPDEFTRIRLTKKYIKAATALGLEKELEQWKQARTE